MLLNTGNNNKKICFRNWISLCKKYSMKNDYCFHIFHFNLDCVYTSLSYWIHQYIFSKWFKYNYIIYTISRELKYFLWKNTVKLKWIFFFNENHVRNMWMTRCVKNYICQDNCLLYFVFDYLWLIVHV